MNYRALNPEDIQVFSEAISTFFERMTQRPARVRTAYMLDRPETILWNDFNGVIQVAGGFRGAISFSAPQGLLTEVLSAMGEAEQSVENFLDVAGEIANILSGRARRHFGEALDIATPISCVREGAVIPNLAEGPAFVIPHTWGPYEAHLVVHLDLIQRR
ncbi:MAG: chemotaxis protein CheX [Sulfuritalea sp.]|nr:chemotaxis protein CheX [Sulfuritalea sp.]